jgi:hypothetical protein
VVVPDFSLLRHTDFGQQRASTKNTFQSCLLSGSIVHLSCQSRSNDERGLVIISPVSLFRFAFTFDLPELGLFDELVDYSNKCVRIHVTNRDENRA